MSICIWMYIAFPQTQRKTIHVSQIKQVIVWENNEMLYNISSLPHERLLSV